MEITTLIAMDPCPRCNDRPQIQRRGQFQARCACGVCAPAAHSSQAAARSWQSFVRQMSYYEARATEQLQLADCEPTRAKPAPSIILRGWKALN